MSAWCNFKIQRTTYATGRDIGEGELPDELLALQVVGRWDGIHIFPDAEPGPDGHWQFPRISAGWEPEARGYVIQCFETAASRSFFLSTAADVSVPTVYAELGAAAQELWPAELFVPYGLALGAIQHFLSTGRQDPQRSWVGLNDFARVKVARRPREPR